MRLDVLTVSPNKQYLFINTNLVVNYSNKVPCLPGHFLAYYASDHWASVNADSYFEMSSARRITNIVHRFDHVHGHQTHFPCMRIAALFLVHGKSSRDHVGISNCFHLIIFFLNICAHIQIIPCKCYVSRLGDRIWCKSHSAC